MRGLVYLVLALVGVLLIGLTTMLVRPQSWWPQASASIYNMLAPRSTQRVVPAATPDKAKTESDHKRSAQAHREGQASAAPMASALGAPPVASASAERSQFPVAGQIQPGTSRAIILATFGRPQATVTGADTGQLRERYIYTDPSTGRKTFIFMINSVVTTAETVSQ